jgi:hypothetical protein
MLVQHLLVWRGPNASPRLRAWAAAHILAAAPPVPACGFAQRMLCRLAHSNNTCMHNSRFYPVISSCSAATPKLLCTIRALPAPADLHLNLHVIGLLPPVCTRLAFVVLPDCAARLVGPSLANEPHDAPLNPIVFF